MVSKKKRIEELEYRNQRLWDEFRELAEHVSTLKCARDAAVSRYDILYKEVELIRATAITRDCVLLSTSIYHDYWERQKDLSKTHKITYKTLDGSIEVWEKCGCSETTGG